MTTKEELSEEERLTRVRFSDLFQGLLYTQEETERIRKQTTERYEQQLSYEIQRLANIVEDLAVIVREHLSCHDCPPDDQADHVV